MPDLHDQILDVFRQVFAAPNLVLRDDMTAYDVEGWDSLAHVDLMLALERRLNIQFATAEISRMREPGQNVGALLRLIDNKVGSRS
jgi:acyl carrier protein